jgi:NitT/TauT family transport system substrate-binding protein
MRAFLSATVATILLQCGSAAAADQINVAVIGSIVDTPFYIARDHDFFKNEGLDVNFVSFDSGAKAIVPLATGELDIGSGALSVAFYNAMGRGVMIRVVADKGHTGPGYYHQSVFVRKDLIDSGAFRSLNPDLVAQVHSPALACFVPTASARISDSFRGKVGSPATFSSIR